MAAVLTAAAVAWLGYYLHNVNDLPGQTLVNTLTQIPLFVLLIRRLRSPTIRPKADQPGV